MSSSTTSARGNIKKKPLVGLGVVGTYTLTKSVPRWDATSPVGVPVWKAIVQLPARGYWINKAVRNALPLLENKVSDTFFTLL